MESCNKLYPKILLIGLTLAFLLTFYGKIIISPNSYLFNSNGDGIKNYFTYAQQIKEKSYFTSEAMNYPYGEIFMYLDCHPALTLMLKALSVPFPIIQNYSIGIVNLLMIFSIGLAAWLLFLIFRRLCVDPWLAALSAFSIAVLSPQIFRLTGHYALSYSCFFPLTWYLLIRFYTSDRIIKWSLFLGLNALFWFFIHAYLGMIAVAFTASVLAIDFLISFRKRVVDFHFYIALFLQSILPMILFRGFVWMIDTHTGRTHNPFGYLQYTSNFDSVFFPTYPPLSKIAKAYFNIQQQWEGLSYIGIISIIAIITASIYFLIKILTRNVSLKSISENERWMYLSLTSSVILLFLSFGYPFSWNMEYLLDKLSLLKNFRGVGRFAWVFFYVITVFSVWFLSRLFESKNVKYKLNLVLFVVPVLYFSEGLPYHQDIAKHITQSPNYFNESYLDSSLKTALHSIQPEQYQAIIPLPFYHIGSENFGKEATDKSYRLSMLFGYHTQIPLMSNYSTRTSIWEAKKVMQIVSPGFYLKEVKADITDRKPFLIIHTKEELPYWENDMKSRATLLFENDELALYEISYRALVRNPVFDWLKLYNNIKDQLVTIGDGFEVFAKDSLSYLYYNSFDSHKDSFVFAGEGALSGLKKDYTPLKQFEKGELKQGKQYTVSFWIYNGGDNFGQDVPGGVIFINTIDNKGNVQWLDIQSMSYSEIINENWSMIEYTFTAPSDSTENALYIKADDHSKVVFHLDELLIREKGVDMYKILQGMEACSSMLFVNNHRLMLP